MPKQLLNVLNRISISIFGIALLIYFISSILNLKNFELIGNLAVDLCMIFGGIAMLTEKKLLTPSRIIFKLSFAITILFGITQMLLDLKFI
jgi:hypothetical protein